MTQALAVDELQNMSFLELSAEYARLSGQECSLPLSVRLVWEECCEWFDEVEPTDGSVVNSPEWELKELADIQVCITNRARLMNYDLVAATKRVYMNNIGRMHQPDGTILRREGDNKIMKNLEYPKVTLSDLT